MIRHSVNEKQKLYNFQPYFAQEKYNELECKLLERMECIELQIKNIQALTSSTKQINLVIQVTHQYAKIKDFYAKLKQQQVAWLLSRQACIQQTAQLRDLINQYQDRIQEMKYNIYNKEVDISVDHTGKFIDEKPVLFRVREFSKFKTQIQNICNLDKIILEYRRNIRRLNKSNGKSIKKLKCHQTSQIIASIQSCQGENYRSKTQNCISLKGEEKDYMETARTKQSDTSSSSESNPEVEKKRKKRKMILINGQQNLYTENDTQFDPQINKIWEMLQIQKQRQINLKREYTNLRAKLGDFCLENLQLAQQYKKLIETQKLQYKQQQSK